jgi:hypothetical protein
MVIAERTKDRSKTFPLNARPEGELAGFLPRLTLFPKNDNIPQ